MPKNRFQVPLLALALLLAASQATSNAGQENPPAASQKPDLEKIRLEKLVKELGNKSWKRREEAQKKIIKAGNTALPLLKKYSSSPDVELARRARILREKLDPLISTFHLLEIRPGNPSEILAQYTGEGQSRRAFKLLGDKPEGRKLSSYVVSWESNDPGRYQVQIREGASQVNPGAILNTPLPTTSTFSILKLGEEVRYEHRGIVTHRDRFPLLKIIHQEHHRLSETADDYKSAFSLDFVTRMLLEQAHSGELSERIEALAILVQLAPPQARTIFLTALKQPQTSALGALGLASIGDASATGLLLKIIEEPASSTNEDLPLKPPGNSPKDPDSRLDAAIELCRGGDLRGVDYLLQKLSERDIGDLFRVLSTLADLTPEIALQPGLRERFLRLALRADNITQAPWNFFQYETEYFFSRAIGILDPKKEEDRALASKARDVFEGMALGQYGASTIRLGTIFPLWKRINRVCAGDTKGRQSPEKPPAELSFIEKILPKVESSTGLGEVLERIRSYFAGESLPDSFLKLVMKNLVRCAAKGQETMRYAALRGARDLSEVVILSPGQLKILLGAMLELYEDKTNSNASLSSTSNLLLPELRRLSGLALKQSAGTGRKADLKALRGLLQDDPGLAKREKYHIAKQAQTDGKDLTCYQFLLRIKTSPGSGKSFKLLDGHRHLLQANRPLNYENRWGERKEIRLSTPKGAVRSTGFSQLVPTYRLNSFNSLSEGIPTFISSIRSNSGIKWYEISRNEAKARFLNRVDSTRDQSLLLVIARDDDLPEPDLDNPAENGADLEALWKEFLRRHYLETEGAPTPRFRSSFMRIQRQLRIPAGIAVLKRWLKQNPAVDLAELLHELGDPTGLDHLARLMVENNELVRIQAGRALCSNGTEAGADFLLDLATSDQAVFARNSYNIFSSFQKYIEKRGIEDTRTRKMLTLVLGLIDQTRYQSSGFRVIRQVAGQDFGYYARSAPGASIGRQTPSQLTAKQRREAAVKAARAWWKNKSRDIDAEKK